MSHSERPMIKGLKRYLSPTFLVVLLISFALWYIKKLSYSYVTEIPVTVVAMGQQLKVSCRAEGTGYDLLTYKHFLGNRVELNEGDLQPAPGSSGKQVYVVNLFALQNAISVKLNDLKIISVSEPPEVVVPEATISGQ